MDCKEPGQGETIECRRTALRAQECEVCDGSRVDLCSSETPSLSRSEFVGCVRRVRTYLHSFVDSTSSPDKFQIITISHLSRHAVLSCDQGCFVKSRKTRPATRLDLDQCAFIESVLCNSPMLPAQNTKQMKHERTGGHRQWRGSKQLSLNEPSFGQLPRTFES